MKSLLLTLCCLIMVVFLASGQEQKTSCGEDLEEKGEIAMAKASTFPNPSTESFTIILSEKADEKTTAKIYNQSGRLVTEVVWVENSTELKIEGFEKGIYWILITQSKQTHSIRHEVQ